MAQLNFLDLKAQFGGTIWHLLKLLKPSISVETCPGPDLQVSGMDSTRLGGPDMDDATYKASKPGELPPKVQMI